MNTKQLIDEAFSLQIGANNGADWCSAFLDQHQRHEAVFGALKCHANKRQKQCCYELKAHFDLLFDATK